MNVIVAGTLLILSLALVIVFVVALPNLVEGQRVLTPEGEAMTRAARRRAAKAARRAAAATARQAEATRASVAARRGEAGPDGPSAAPSHRGEPTTIDLREPISEPVSETVSDQISDRVDQAIAGRSAAGPDQARRITITPAPINPPINLSVPVTSGGAEHTGPGSNVPEQKKAQDSAQPEVSETIAG